MSAPVRRPAVAGRFYASDPARLRAEVRGYLDAAGAVPLAGPPIGAVVPHAGLMFSGPVAAYSYQALQTSAWDVAVLVGGSHHFALQGAHVYADGAWASPLGEFPIAEDLAADLIGADDCIVADAVPHGPEHSLEVQLPFLAETIGLIPIVPVLVNPTAPDACAALGNAIGALDPRRRVAIIASTDLSHYHADTVAHALDRAAIDAICAWRPETLAAGAADHEIELCGGGAVAAAEIAAEQRGAVCATLLHYATSGDVPEGGKDRVVGYAAIAFLGGADTTALPPLTTLQADRLLQLARSTLEAHVTGRALPTPPKDDPRLCEPQGVFVTLRRWDGTLRGCLGRTERPLPLAEGVIRLTESAASRDTRFPPIVSSETRDIRIEISVLSPLEPVADPADLVIGRDGLMLTYGRACGLLLPQVAPAQGWDVPTFLEGICRKAGLPPETWRKPDALLERFTAHVIQEPRRPA